MGGALSIIFAQACAVSQPQLAERIAGIYTYGCPRCGDLAFAEVSRLAIHAGACSSGSHDAADRRPAHDELQRSSWHSHECGCRLEALWPRRSSTSATGSTRTGWCTAPTSSLACHQSSSATGATRVQHAACSTTGGECVPSCRHVGLEHYVTSFGQVLTEPHMVKRWHLIEGIGFVPLQLYKIVRGLARRQESGLRSVYRLVLLVLLPGLSDHYPADYERQLRLNLQKQGQ